MTHVVAMDQVERHQAELRAEAAAARLAREGRRGGETTRAFLGSLVTALRSTEPVSLPQLEAYPYHR